MKPNSTGLLLATFALLAATVDATTINFDDLTGAGSLPGNYAGLVWENWTYYDSPDTPYDASSGAERIANTFESSDHVGTVKFGGPVTFRGLWMAGYATDQWVEGYVGGVKLFESTHTANTWDPFGQSFLLDWNGVDEIRIQSTGIGDVHGYYVIDDLSYSTSVPDAGGGLLLMSSGFAAAVILRGRVFPPPWPTAEA